MERMAIGASAGLAGCSQSRNNNSDKKKKQTESGLPNPQNREYSDIEYGLEMPERIERVARYAESKVDRTAFEDGLLERNESYLDVTDAGSQSIIRDADDKQMEQDLYEIEIELDANKNFESEESVEVMTDIYSQILPGITTAIYEQDSETPDETVISGVSATIKGEETYANTSWSMQEGNLEELTEAHLESNEDNEAVEDTVRSNLIYEK